MSIRNPVLKGFYPDPSICRAGDDYFLVTSSFTYYPGIPLFHSKNLINFKQIGHVLTRRSQLNLNGIHGGIFAPTIRHYNGTFYVITTNVNGGGNFFVKTSDPFGEWSDPIWVDDNTFDPSLFFDDDGKVYYTRRDFMLNGIVQAEIDLETGRLFAPPNVIAKGFCSWDVEGPHLYKINGQYYLMCAEGGTRYGHMETIARSKSPWGPFEPCPRNPILTQRHISMANIRHTGHAELIQAHNGSWWMFFLATRHNFYEDFTILGRETFIAPVTWGEDGWPVVNGNRGITPEINAEMPFPFDNAEETGGKDHFNCTSLSYEYNFIRNPTGNNWSLNENPGCLRLYCSAPRLSDIDGVSFVGRRQQDFVFTASAKMAFNFLQEEDEAGICVYTSESYYYKAGVIKLNGKNMLFGSKRIGDIDIVNIVKELFSNEVILQINGDENYYYFSYIDNSGNRTKIMDGMAKFLCNELADVFTGNYIGMYATSNGKISRSYADFDWFEYKGFPDNRRGLLIQNDYLNMD